MHRFVRLGTAVVACACLATTSGLAAGYPMTLKARANFTNGDTTITSVVTIKVEKTMQPAHRTDVLDGLKYNGYQGFMNALRPLPVIGQVATQTGKVDLRYAWETKVDDRRRLILVADKPLFFLASNTSKPRAGYELTVVDLLLDDRGGGSGTIAGAARVKPAPDGGVVMDQFATSLVKLTIEPTEK